MHNAPGVVVPMSLLNIECGIAPNRPGMRQNLRLFCNNILLGPLEHMPQDETTEILKHMANVIQQLWLDRHGTHASV